MRLARIVTEDEMRDGWVIVGILDCDWQREPIEPIDEDRQESGSCGKLGAKTNRVRNTINDVNKLGASKRLAKALE